MTNLKALCLITMTSTASGARPLISVSTSLIVFYSKIQSGEDLEKNVVKGVGI
jgi:hypothetical protein